MRALSRGVGVHVAVPVEVVLRDVQHGGGVGLEGVRRFELEARQLEHPDIGQRVLSMASEQRVEHRRADVARDGHGLARALAQQAGERGDRGLAVGAGDREDLRRVAASRRATSSARANSSSSPHTGMPRSFAASISGFRSRRAATGPG